MWKKATETIKISFLIIISCVFISTPVLAVENLITINDTPIISPQYTYIYKVSTYLHITEKIKRYMDKYQKLVSFFFNGSFCLYITGIYSLKRRI